MLLVGSNDCTSSSFNETTFQEDYTNLFQVAKLIAENIVLVSLCPRLDDAIGNIRFYIAVLIEPLSNLKEDSLSTVTVLIIRQFFNNDVTSPYISDCII
jgi:hypothetical protein